MRRLLVFEDRAARVREIAERQRWGRRFGTWLVGLVGEPVRKLIAAAVTRRRWSLVDAAGRAGGTAQAHVDVVVVAVPGTHGTEEAAVAPGDVAERALDAGG